MLRSIRRGLFVTGFASFALSAIASPVTRNVENPASSEATTVSKAAAPAQLVVAGFDEPLIAIGIPRDVDTKALKAAIDIYKRQTHPLWLEPLTDYLKAYPDSPWRVGLLTNFGLIHYHYGAFSEAIDDWEEAWRLGARVTGLREKAMVDRALGELIRMHTRIGHADRVAALLDEAEKRHVGGPATEAIAGAKEGLWMMRNEPGVAYLCGPMALKSILMLQNPKSPGIPALEKVRSGKHGVSLAEVNKMAREVGMHYAMAKREGDAPIPIPSVIHWKISHYAAVVGKQNGRYHIIDPTFGNDLWVPRSVLNKESSGYFLIPRDKMGPGWDQVALGVAENVRGMGYTSSNPIRTTPCDNKNSNTCGGSSTGMAVYGVHSMQVSLNIEDTTVSYMPPKGSAIPSTIPTTSVRPLSRSTSPASTWDRSGR